MKKFHEGYQVKHTKVKLANSQVWRLVIAMNKHRTKIIVSGVSNEIMVHQVKQLTNRL